LQLVRRRAGSGGGSVGGIVGSVRHSSIPIVSVSGIISVSGSNRGAHVNPKAGSNFKTTRAG